MALNPGTRLGPYEVSAQIGVGGMGEVYRATDTNLGRQVAIKVLPDAFLHDPERLTRFEREAKTLALLSHSNIAIVYGLESADGMRALVMELVEGPTLADRIAQGPIATDEALSIANQIAEALEAAHEQGIIHRDLKPANVKLRGDGTVKVLDFGLAKALEPAGALSPGASQSPTITSRAMMTGVGVLLGTAAYMSPEQARGKPVDRRADLWAFGCVLFEMLSGRQAFEGTEVTDVLARVIEREPDFAALPATVPAPIRRLLRRCFEKDRRRRLADAADARLEIDDALIAHPLDAQPVASRARRMWIERLAWSLVTLGLVASLCWVLWRPVTGTSPVRTTLTLPQPLELEPSGGSRRLAISPDGRSVAFVARSASGSHIYLRRADQFDPVPVRGTEGGTEPFFSPDGQWLGFMAGGVQPAVGAKLKKVPIGGGTPTTLCDAVPRGASWGPDDTIVFAASPTGGLSRVRAGGGTAEPLTKLEPTERTHRWPSFLPGGKAILFAIQPEGASFDDALIAVRSIDTGEQRVVAQGGSSPIYVSTGHIVFGRAGVLLAMPFDLGRLQATGPAVPVLDGVVMNTATGDGEYAIAAGSVVYSPATGSESGRELLWVDRKGVASPVVPERRYYDEIALSPDGQRIAIAQNSDIWAYEIARGTMRRVTFASGGDAAPTWTPDGRHITFSRTRTSRSILQVLFDGSGGEERVMDAGRLTSLPRSWHPSGKWLAYELAQDIYVLPLTGERTPKPFVATPFVEAFPAFSPDGRWIAYQSSESGRFEIYVQSFPEPGGKWQVSTDGGLRPRWSRDGRELFFRVGGRVVAVPIEPGPTFAAGGTARVLFEGAYAPPYDVAADGRFLMVRDDLQANPTQLRFVQNWFEELKRLAPTK